MSQHIPPDIVRGRLSEEEKAQIIHLAERKFTCGRIAQKLNRHPSTINFAMHWMGLKKLVGRRPDYTRGGVPVRGFSEEEDAYITACRTEGLTTTNIAMLVGVHFGHKRSAATINVRLRMLASTEEAA